MKLFFHLCDFFFHDFLYVYCFGIRTGSNLGRRIIDITQTLLFLLSFVTFITELTVLPTGEHKILYLEFPQSMVAIPCVLRITLALANQFMSHNILNISSFLFQRSEIMFTLLCPFIGWDSATCELPFS
jgi:hypothetical protein